MTSGQLAVLFLVGGDSGRAGGEDHLARLVGDLDEEVLDSLKINVGHSEYISLCCHATEGRDGLYLAMYGGVPYSSVPI